MPVPLGSENDKPPPKPGHPGQPVDPSKLLDHMSLLECKRRESIVAERVDCWRHGRCRTPFLSQRPTSHEVANNVACQSAYGQSR